MPNVVVACFSPTRSTRRLAETVGGAVAAELGAATATVDFTLPAARPTCVECGTGDVLVFGFPVYAGRVPVLVANEVARWEGDGATAVIAGVYGNRDFDDALVEAADLLAAQGFRVAAAGAFVAEHSSTRKVATGRPDTDDLAVAERFGRKAAARIASGAAATPAIRGNRPYKEHPAAMDIRPQTTDACTACGACIARCPMGVIHADDPAVVDAGCIRCNACVKSCPEDAKFFDDDFSNMIRARLEGHFTARREPELFL
ncbi:4Fe-4S dicluster domain-containing protein [Arabiibacter massiliensis]|uniref:4Fe-4S dicluster domain-containing protein n=1 Tax=Arabiibacter massiliensis TaxID=1870985 RepID=UPI0009BA8D0A|nr:4Fe-4S dicluster domain-containing protein [Arabiibacter massiliensis]